MIQHLRVVPLLYLHPVRAFHALLDHGSGTTALLLAAAVLCMLWLPGPRPAAVYQPVAPAYSSAQDDADYDIPVATPMDRATAEGLRFLAPSGPAALAMLILVFIPIAIVIVARLDSLGTNGVVLRRDYMPVLATVVTAWAAAYLPAAILRWFFPTIALPIAAHVYFLVLSVIALRVILGTSAVRAATATMGACCASILVLSGSGVWSPMLYVLGSPCLIYMVYASVNFEIGMLSRGLSGRQSLKRNLEAAALNPRDADAHYQLGLIYAQRRSYAEAQASFEMAMSIDAEHAESRYELGRVFAAQNRFSEAVDQFQRAAAFDDKLASNEVWRELGLSYLRLGNTAEALAALEKYTDRRAYDPEGLVHYGNALKQAGKPAEAREQFQRAVVAVKTMPGHRRNRLARWQKEAQDGLARCSS